MGAKKRSPKIRFRLSEAFHLASIYEIHSRTILGRMEEAGTVMWAPKQSCAVLESLAAELLFKCLLWMDHGQVPRAHGYVELYRALTYATRKRVREECRKRLDSPGFRRMIRKLGLRESAADFHSFLRVHSHAFVRWRYTYEIPRGHQLRWLGGPVLLPGLREIIVARESGLAQTPEAQFLLKLAASQPR